MRALVRWLTKEFRGQVVVGLVLFILSTCATAAQPATLPPAHLPLADLQTSKLANLQQAAYYYNRYHELAPDDLLGLKRLTEVCAALEQAGVEDESCREAAALRETLETRTDDQRIVAELLDVPVEDVELGPNLVENGGFEEWVRGKPREWKWSNMATGNPWNKGAFAGGADVLSGGIGGGLSARVDGLWLQHDRDKAAGRCGWWVSEKADLDNGGIYVISVSYRTRNSTTAAIQVRMSSRYAVNLPATYGVWVHFVDLIQDSTELDTVHPLLRLYALGRVWFDDVSIRPITVGYEQLDGE